MSEKVSNAEIKNALRDVIARESELRNFLQEKKERKSILEDRLLNAQKALAKMIADDGRNVYINMPDGLYCVRVVPMFDNEGNIVLGKVGDYVA